METTELRIGNYFQWKSIASMGRGIDRITHGQQIMDYISFKEGVPLTEDWLLKFGFEKEENGYYKSNRHHIVVNETGFYYRVPGTTLTRIDFIHQLQNLYFALTGTELETKD